MTHLCREVILQTRRLRRGQETLVEQEFMICLRTSLERPLKEVSEKIVQSSSPLFSL